MPYEPFHARFLETARRETRTLSIMKNNPLALPPDVYTFIEAFCNERGCDCRRVFFLVYSSRRKGPEAIIAYGWEDQEFYQQWMRSDDPVDVDILKGPILNPLSPRSELAPALLVLCKSLLLKDPVYVERVKAHYAMFRREIESERGRATRRNRKPRRRRS
jgi:hypothetical protein